MGCTITVDSTIPIKLDWFRVAIENDLAIIQQMKNSCLYSYCNGLCALHYAIIYNSADVFFELLQDESLLLTSSKSNILNRSFSSDSNVFQLAVISDNMKLAKYIMDYFLSLKQLNTFSNEHKITLSSIFNWFLINAQHNCVPLIHHQLFDSQNKNGVPDRFKSFEPENSTNNSKEEQKNSQKNEEHNTN
ncbi:Ankyrin_repeat-containing domain superfamily [Hexamita inflata]|uniref:Ankyrin repeat-containing domain superfamily n=1 Tax=Hexamita inflata TaxID=28002 RepID=A0AA86NJP0_9EUKA|nr:Ankyrin repeat-containing domain superfamily [Hexamita inflata]CAI9967453.1 Ankyrin repeat-containing domain superfamily [Hexamita inflata]